jgi:DNA-binding MarR family transcriptional regulator
MPRKYKQKHSACIAGLTTPEKQRELAMADIKWYTQKEIADMLSMPLPKLYPRVSALRKAGVIITKPDPDDDRVLLISSESLDVIKRATGRA